MGYYPDFVLIDKETNFHTDIEIDEPYAVENINLFITTETMMTIEIHILKKLKPNVLDMY